jgi:hypothetical protein
VPFIVRSTFLFYQESGPPLIKKIFDIIKKISDVPFRIDRRRPAGPVLIPNRILPAEKIADMPVQAGRFAKNGAK